MLNKNSDPINFEKEIDFLKNQLNAKIISHNFQDSEIQDISDFVGSSAEIIKYASKVDCEYIFLCANKNLAESVYIVSGLKKVIIPDLMLNSNALNDKYIDNTREYKKENTVILSSLNLPARMIVESDYIISTDKAENIIDKIDSDKDIIFISNKNLGLYFKNKLGREIKVFDENYTMHDLFSESELVKLKTEYPKAEIIAHIECNPKLLNYADYVGDSAALIDYVEKRDGTDFIVLCNAAIIHKMRKLSPSSSYIDVPIHSNSNNKKSSICPKASLNNLEKLYLSMKNKNPIIKLEKKIIVNVRAKLEECLNNM